MMVFKKSALGWYLILTISFIPALIWMFEPAGARFGDWQAVSLSLAQIFGLTGFAMFAVNLVLSARLHFLEKYFFGLSDLYHRHALLGKLAGVCLLAHPIFLLPAYVSSLTELALFLLPGPNWATNFGKLSLFLVTIILALTLYWRPRFDLWKTTHQFMGLAFFFAALHVYLIPSNVAVNQFLRVYVLGLALAALLAYVYRTLLGRFLVKRYDYIVSHVSRLAENIMELTLEPIGKRMNFISGQFVFIRIIDGLLSQEEHPFSMTSNPETKELKLAIKQLGDYTKNLDKLAPGIKVKLEGPFGIFSYTKAQHKNQIWIAGGIGITPFLSMLQAMQKETGYKVDFYYCVKNRSEAVFLGMLENISPAVKVIPFYSDLQGYITADEIEKLSGGLRDKDIFLCAPPVMMRSLKKQLSAKGVFLDLLHSEEFEL